MLCSVMGITAGCASESCHFLYMPIFAIYMFVSLFFTVGCFMHKKLLIFAALRDCSLIMLHTPKSLLTGVRSCPGAEHTHDVTCRYIFTGEFHSYMSWRVRWEHQIDLYGGLSNPIIHPHGVRKLFEAYRDQRK